ncbi:MAG: hypothetical protein M3520_01130 [Actinomycetota bacterium]|nr:hypothetical protein [Actinomycetota bacterium]
MTRQLLATLGLLARLGLGAVLLVAGALKIGPVRPGQANYLGPLLRDGLLAGAAGWLVGRPRTPVSVDALLPPRGTAR